jgi:hypothetical protein
VGIHRGETDAPQSFAMTNPAPRTLHRHALPISPVVIWGIVCVAAVPGGLASIALAIVAVAAALWLERSWPSRAMTAAAALPVAALGDLPTAGWIGSALLLAGAYELSKPSAAAAARRALAELEVHIARCRRRGEPGHVLVIGDLDIDAQPLDLFRLTDSVAIWVSANGPELRAVIDDDSFDRVALEQRIRDRLGAAAEVGWAKFPDDGVTLEVLLQHARDAARGIAPVPMPALTTVYPLPRPLAAEHATE